jgi:parallel beta-helix repeat protein
VMVNKSINLFGENRETTIIDANKSGSPINLNTSFITICGFTVQNSGENEIGVESGIVRDYHSSPFPRVCDNITIMGNIIINNKFGIYFSYSNNISIINNIITQNKHCGILCTRTHTSTIEHNEVTKNDEGIGIYSSGSTEITHNHIKENNVSIRLWGSSINHISENSILNSSDTGIILDGNVNTRIKANNFINNTNDAYFEYAILPFTGNRFINNYWDSNTGSGPKTIIGTYEMALLSVTIGILAAYILGGYGFPEIIIKWFVFDWNPAKEPYDIPGMS